jgi:uncharacterized protein YcbK (DUF882 family)
MTKNRQFQNLYIAIAGVLMASCLFSCGNKHKADGLYEGCVQAVEEPACDAAFRVAREEIAAAFPADGSAAATPSDTASKPAAPAAQPADDSDSRHQRLLALLTPEDTVRSHNPFELHLDSMPAGGVKMKINWLGGSLGRVLNDSNKFHLEVAMANGIEPIYSLNQAWQQGNRMEKLRTCEAYYLDDLTHSMPYLVPKAHKLLKDIGMAFRDSLKARGGGNYRIKVTSVLRTPALVKQLRRRNRNAVDTSAHLFGTTFDISYLKFICDSIGVPRTQEDMKNLLGEVVEQMRQQERCFVKFERKQACYHITVR